MISRKWDCTLTGRNLLFPYCDYKGSFQSLMNPMREKLKDVTLFLFTLLGICHKSNPIRKSLKTKDYGKI